MKQEDGTSGICVGDISLSGGIPSPTYHCNCSDILLHSSPSLPPPLPLSPSPPLSNLRFHISSTLNPREEIRFLQYCNRSYRQHFRRRRSRVCRLHQLFRWAWSQTSLAGGESHHPGNGLVHILPAAVCVWSLSSRVLRSPVHRDLS